VSVIADKAARPVTSAARRRLELVASRDAALLSIGTVGSGLLAYLAIAAPTRVTRGMI
jgi:hypothetical protein